MYSVIGCGDYEMDSSLEGVAYVKHVTAERVVIGCNETGNSFALTCEQGRWIGVETNCSGLFHRESSFYRVAYSLLTVVKISRGARRPLLELVGAKFSVQGVGMPPGVRVGMSLTPESRLWFHYCVADADEESAGTRSTKSRKSISLPPLGERHAFTEFQF